VYDTSYHVLPSGASFPWVIQMTRPGSAIGYNKLLCKTSSWFIANHMTDKWDVIQLSYHEWMDTNGTVL